MKKLLLLLLVIGSLFSLSSPLYADHPKPTFSIKNPKDKAPEKPGPFSERNVLITSVAGYSSVYYDEFYYVEAKFEIYYAFELIQKKGLPKVVGSVQVNQNIKVTCAPQTTIADQKFKIKSVDRASVESLINQGYKFSHVTILLNPDKRYKKTSYDAFQYSY